MYLSPWQRFWLDFRQWLFPPKWMKRPSPPWVKWWRRRKRPKAGA